MNISAQIYIMPFLYSLEVKITILKGQKLIISITVCNNHTDTDNKRMIQIQIPKSDNHIMKMRILLMGSDWRNP
jgi:hypothetical protein